MKSQWLTQSARARGSKRCPSSSWPTGGDTGLWCIPVPFRDGTNPLALPVWPGHLGKFSQAGSNFNAQAIHAGQTSAGEAALRPASRSVCRVLESVPVTLPLSLKGRNPPRPPPVNVIGIVKRHVWTGFYNNCAKNHKFICCFLTSKSHYFLSGGVIDVQRYLSLRRTT